MSETKPRKRGLFGNGSLLDNIRAAQRAADPSQAASSPNQPEAEQPGAAPPGPSAEGRPADDRRFKHPWLTGLLVALVIGALWFVSSRAVTRVQTVVQDYVSALRAGDMSTAYGMVAAQRRAGLSLEQWQSAMYTELLAHSTGLDIARTEAGSAGKGCVVLAVEDHGQRVALTFFVADDKYVHSIYANEDFNGSPGPWNCDP